jgi:hypothetical protein
VADEKKIVDLSEVRLRRNHEAGHLAHERGEAFMFEEYVFTDDIGILDDDRVCVLLKPAELTGIVMTRDDAKKLGEALIGAASAVVPTEEKG